MNWWYTVSGWYIGLGGFQWGSVGIRVNWYTVSGWYIGLGGFQWVVLNSRLTGELIVTNSEMV